MANLIEYRGYHGTIEFSAEDNLFVGSVIGVRDCLNFHGSSVSEITNSFHDCIDGYLEMCKELGRDPDKEYRGTFNIRISPDLHRDAELQAKKDGVTLNQFVQSAIEEKVKRASSSGCTYVFFDASTIPASAFYGSSQNESSSYTFKESGITSWHQNTASN